MDETHLTATAMPVKPQIRKSPPELFSRETGPMQALNLIRSHSPSHSSWFAQCDEPRLRPGTLKPVGGRRMRQLSYQPNFLQLHGNGYVRFHNPQRRYPTCPQPKN